MSKVQGKKIDVVSDNMIKAIFRYTIPLILGTLIQNCFNAIDLMVLGNMADSNAVASVGATSMIVSLIVHTFVGISAGCKIILSHMFGAGKHDRIKKTMDTAILTALGIGVAIAVLAIPLIPSILSLTNCPAECFEGAVIYTRIYIGAAPAILLYNFGSAILTSTGDSKRPLYYIIISGGVNVVLNILLCLILPQKVVAVALATGISQLVGGALVMRRLCRMEGTVKIQIKKMRFEINAFGQIMKQGLPLALNTALYPFANLQIQSAINVFGISAIAGNSACGTIEGVPGAFSGSFGSTAVVFVGQNLGAKKRERARQAFRYCLICNCLLGLLLGVGIYLTGEFWLTLFLPDDPQGILYGMIRMFYVVLFYPVACANSVLSATIQSHGYAIYTSVCSIISVCVFRLIWMWFVYPAFQTFDMLMACFTVSWLLLLMLYIIGYFIFVRKGFEKQWETREGTL